MSENVATVVGTGPSHAPAIPRRLHYCWYGGKALTELGQRCTATWREVIPDYAVIRWDEQQPATDHPYVAAAYRQGQYAFVADYMRLLRLWEQGGIYLDTDVEVLRRFDDLLRYPLFFGLQAPGNIGCAVIGAMAGHTFLRRALDELDAEARSGQISFQPLPEMITRLVHELPEGERPVVFPEEYFYPYNPYSPVPLQRKPLQSHISEHTYCIHHWEGAWLGDMSLRMMVDLRVREAVRRIGSHLRSNRLLRRRR